MVWVFGYGSLTWKVGFPFEEKRVGYVKGFIRRFWWWSEDHRGVPGRPGRVVNLISTGKESDRVYGVAYRINDDLWKSEVEAHLDHREKGGYERVVVSFHTHNVNVMEEDTLNFDVIVYLGCVTNRHFTGETTDDDVAKTIQSAVGPSGPNRDYFLHLCHFMDELGVHDPHLDKVKKVFMELEGISKEDEEFKDEKKAVNKDDIEEE